MNGKNKCKLLKEIRQKIADENDISYITTECKFQGDCTGTCPKCEAEVRYLEQELDKRRRTGRVVAVAGIAAAMVVTAAGCEIPENQLDGAVGLIPTETVIVKGEIEAPTEITEAVTDDEITEGTELLVGEAPYEISGRVSEPEEPVLTGDVAWPLP